MVDTALILAHLRKHWSSVVIIHLLFTLLGLVLLTPLFGASLQGLLALSGTSAVADQDIARLFLTPLGMTSAVLLISLLIAIAALEVGALQVLAQAAVAGRSITPLQATLYALRHAVQLLRTTIGLTLRILAFLLPYAAALLLIARLFLGDHDINYYLSTRPPAFYHALLIAALPTLVLLWLLGRKLLDWVLVLPLVLFTDTPPRAVFQKSAQLTRGHARDLIRSFIVWALLAILLAMVPALYLKLTTGWIVATPEGNLQTLVFLFGATTLGWTVLNFFVLALNLAAFTFMVATYYRQLAPAPAIDLFESAALEAATGSSRLKPLHVGVGILAVALLAGFVGMHMLRDIKLEDDVLVIAHRGAAGAAPENSLAAVRLAVEHGADWVEIDVQESRDGQVLVVHDSDFMKLSNNPLKVWEGDASELQDIDIGSWFDPAFASERVPTLQQVLEEIRDRSRLVIELKYYGHDQQLEQRVVDIVEAAGMADAVVVMSLKLKGIQKLQDLRPDWTAGLLAATAVGDLSRIDVDFLAVNANMASRGFIKRAHKAGKKVFVWTINDPLSLSHWMSAGVDGVITDEPALARSILAQRAQLGTAERLMLSAALLFGKPQVAKQYRDNSP